MVEGLGKDYEDLLGKGPRDALKQTSQTYKARMKILGRMDTLAEEYRKAGERVTEETLFEEAVSSLFGDAQKRLARKQVASKVEAHGRSAIGRPSHTGTAPAPTAYQSAVKAVQEKMREQGST
jgi:hypothetical protein